MRALLAALVAAALVALGGGAATAEAAVYTVYACNDGHGTGQNHLFSSVGNAGSCAWGSGLWSRSYPAQAPWSVNGHVMTAPAGTSIYGYSVNWHTAYSATANGQYYAMIDGNDGQALSVRCTYIGCSNPFFPVSAPTDLSWVSIARSGLAVGALRLTTGCGPYACNDGWALSDWAEMTVTLSDDSTPAVSAAPAGLAAAGWLRGRQSLTFSASDNSGIRRTRFLVDGAQRSDDARACDYSYAVPCKNVAGDDRYSVDTTALADGPHTFEATARDATDQNSATTGAVPFNVDNHAPGPPVVSVDGGEEARSEARWSVRWVAPPGQAAPIALARYTVCGTSGACTSGSAPGAPGAISGSFGISQPGDYTLKVWLEDAAGNADPARVSAPVHLRFDGGVPGLARPQASPARWLNGADAASYRVPIAMAPGAAVPAAGIAGYAVTTNGSVPGTAADVVADATGRAQYGPPPGGWPAGAVTVKARAISRTGAASPDVGTAQLRLDPIAPATSARGQGTPGSWQPGPVEVTLSARDALSGMGAADDGDPVESGGHIVWTLDGAPLQSARGDHAAVRVAGDGIHSLTFRAYDVAGNSSGDRILTVRIGSAADGVAPPRHGFWDTASNPGSTFTAAASFAEGCPAERTLAPARVGHVDQADPDGAHPGVLAVRSAPAANARAVLAFDLPAPAGCRVATARLRLHASSATAGRTLAALRLGSGWDHTATWTTRPGTTGPAATVATTAAPGWLALDVTEQIQASYRYGDDGLLVRDLAESDPAGAAQVFDGAELKLSFR